MIQIIIQVLTYLFIRFQVGIHMTLQEKHQLLEGLFKMGNEFILEYNKNGSVGSTRMEVSSCGDLCLPEVPIRED